MIIFHEGLPGSGKSYESVVKHLLPALQSRRLVYAYVEGLDHQKISKLLKMDISVLRSLLIQVERDEVLRIHEVVEDNSLVVIDELQNFWPVGKQRLDDKITQFVTEHRHRGIDILALGQDLRDCHALWKRRIDQKVCFMKLDMLGRSSSYKWTVYKAISGEKFEKVSSGVENYDPKYFGTYKSHVSEETNTSDYKDSRAVIWNSKSFRLGLVFILLVGIFSPWYLSRFFNADTSPLMRKSVAPGPVASPVVSPVAVAALPRPVPVVPVSAPAPAPALAPAPASVPSKPPNVDYVGRLGESYRVRLVTVLSSFTRPPYAVIEFRDSSFRVQERLDTAMLSDLGWSVEVVSLRLVRLRKPGQSELIVTAWPLEPFGEVSDRQNEAVRTSAKGSDLVQRVDSGVPVSGIQ